MRAIDADAIVVHKFPSEDYDPSENDAEKAYRKGWNDALDAVAEFQPSAQPEDTIEMQESDIDEAMKLVRDARVTILPSAEPVRCKDCKYWYREIHNGIEYFNFSSCDLNHYGDGHNFYCADAERRTDE